MVHNEHDKNRPEENQSPAGVENTQLDVGYRLLSNALKVSFTLLKVIMAVLVVAFLVSGFRTVGSDERALVLRFGQIRGIGEKRVLGPGPKLLFPYPIHEIIRIPVEKRVTLNIDSFWHSDYGQGVGPDARPRVPATLDPERDGYCLTRTADDGTDTAAGSGSDYNIVHTKWQVTYQIRRPEQFYKNVFVDTSNLEPGQSYTDVVFKSANPLLENIMADAIVTATVQYTIDEVLYKRVAGLTEHVKALVQRKLDAIESGIKVVDVVLYDSTWPLQVDAAFQNAQKAAQANRQFVSDAHTYATKTLNEAGGPVAERLLAAIEDPSVSPEQRELLWSQLAGQARKIIQEAKAYRVSVVAEAEAAAEYLKKILPEYRKRPELVLRNIYQDTIEEILNNADEKYIVQPTAGMEGKELRVLVNKNPALKPKEQQQETQRRGSGQTRSSR